MTVPPAQSPRMPVPVRRKVILACFVSGFNVTLPVQHGPMIRAGLTPTVSPMGVVIWPEDDNRAAGSH